MLYQISRYQGFTLTRIKSPGSYGSKARSPRTGRVTGSENRRQSALLRTEIFLELRTWTNYFSKSNSNKNLEVFKHERRTRTRSTQLWSKAKNSWAGPLFADRLKARDKIHIRDSHRCHRLIYTGQKPVLARPGLAHGPGRVTIQMHTGPCTGHPSWISWISDRPLDPPALSSTPSLSSFGLIVYSPMLAWPTGRIFDQYVQARAHPCLIWILPRAFSDYKKAGRTRPMNFLLSTRWTELFLVAGLLTRTGRPV